MQKECTNQSAAKQSGSLLHVVGVKVLQFCSSGKFQAFVFSISKEDKKLGICHNCSCCGGTTLKMFGITNSIRHLLNSNLGPSPLS